MKNILLALLLTITFTHTLTYVSAGTNTNITPNTDTDTIVISRSEYESLLHERHIRQHYERVIEQSRTPHSRDSFGTNIPLNYRQSLNIHPLYSDLYALRSLQDNRCIEQQFHYPSTLIRGLFHREHILFFQLQSCYLLHQQQMNEFLQREMELLQFTDTNIDTVCEKEKKRLQEEIRMMQIYNNKLSNNLQKFRYDFASKEEQFQNEIVTLTAQVEALTSRLQQSGNKNLNDDSMNSSPPTSTTQHYVDEIRAMKQALEERSASMPTDTMDAEAQMAALDEELREAERIQEQQMRLAMEEAGIQLMD